MEPDYPVYSIVIIKKEPFEKLKIDDVIVYKSNAISDFLVLHRISRITDKGIYTKGDKNQYEDNQLITEEIYIGKNVFCFYSLGLYITAVQSYKGFILFFIVPALSMIALHRLINYIRQKG